MLGEREIQNENDSRKKRLLLAMLNEQVIDSDLETEDILKVLKALYLYYSLEGFKPKYELNYYLEVLERIR